MSKMYKLHQQTVEKACLSPPRDRLTHVGSLPKKIYHSNLIKKVNVFTKETDCIQGNTHMHNLVHAAPNLQT